MRGHAPTSASRIKEAEVTCPLNLQRGGQEAAINHSCVLIVEQRTQSFLFHMSLELLINAVPPASCEARLVIGCCLKQQACSRMRVFE